MRGIQFLPFIQAFSLSVVLLSISFITGPILFPANDNLPLNNPTIHDTTLTQILETNSSDLFYIAVVNGTFTRYSNKTISIPPESNLANGYSRVIFAKFVNTMDNFYVNDTRLDTNVWYFAGLDGHENVLKYNIAIDNTILNELNSSISNAAKYLTSYTSIENLSSIQNLNQSIGTSGLDIMLFYRSGVALQLQIVGDYLITTTFELTTMHIKNGIYAYSVQPDNQIIRYGVLDGTPFNNFISIVNNIITGLPSNT